MSRAARAAGSMRACRRVMRAARRRVAEVVKTFGDSLHLSNAESLRDFRYGMNPKVEELRKNNLGAIQSSHHAPS